MSPSSFPRLVNIIDQAALVEHLRPCVCVCFFRSQVFKHVRRNRCAEVVDFVLRCQVEQNEQTWRERRIRSSVEEAQHAFFGGKRRLCNILDCVIRLPHGGREGNLKDRLLA